MSHATRLASLVLVLGPLALVASACGGGFADKPVDDIVTAAQKATAATSSVHAVGHIKHEVRLYDVDLHLSRTGACRGELTRKDRDSRKELRIEMLVVGDQSFFRGVPSLLEETGLVPADPSAQVTKQVRDLGPRWVEGDLKWLARLCDMDDVLATVDAQDWVQPASGADVKVAGTQEIAGVRVVKVTSKQADSKARMFVAAGDPHQVLRLASRGPDGMRKLTFSDYDIPVGTLPPDPADVVKLRLGRP